MSPKLKEIYQAQLVRVGVSLSKAEQAAQNVTANELKLIGEIWQDWANVLSEHQGKKANE